MSQEPNTTAEPGSASVDPHSVEGLFVAALGKSTPEERTAFLDEACGRDAEMRRRVEALLRAYDDAGSFLEQPAVDQPTAVGGDDEIRLDFLAPTDKPDRLGMLGHYEIIEVIGRGGMGIVLRALDPKLNRVVAIKALLSELAANPNARRRFTREARAAASINHPHIVTIHAVEEEPWPFLVMECVAGQSLQEKLDKVGSLRLTEVLRIGRQIAEGLSAAHKQGLIHRDIKPANILLENGVERVKITDFGLARTADDIAITKTGEVHGTPQYMSPEQARGERVNQRSDLFSLGCVLYAMCSGRPPFRAESLAGVMHRVINDQPRPLLELNPETPGWLIDIVTTLLAKDPEDRYQSADEVAAILEEHLAVAQGAAPTGQPLQARRHRRSQRGEVHRGAHETDRRHWLSAALMVIAIAFLSYAVTRAFGVRDQMVSGATIVLGLVLGGVMLAHWISRRPVRPRPVPTVFGLAAFVVGAMAGCEDGGHLLYGIQKEYVCSAAIVLGLGALIGSWLLAPRRHHERTLPAPERGNGMRQPATVLLWLAVAVVSLMLLAPCVIFLPWYLSKSEPLPAPRDTPLLPPPDSSLMGGDEFSQMGEEDYAATTIATGALILEFADNDLAVELRPLDSDADDVETAIGRPGNIFHGGGTFELGARRYRPVVYDGAFGWIGETVHDPALVAEGFGEASAADMEEMYGMGAFGGPQRPGTWSYEMPPIEIKEGRITTLTVARNFAALAANEPDWSRGGLYRFQWSGQEYLLTKPQAKMVNYLFWAFAEGKPEVSPARLSNAFEFDDDKSLIESISVDVPDQFRYLFNDGAHPAWGTLIVTSEAGNTYRLAEPGRPVPSEPGVAVPDLVVEAVAADIGPTLTVESTPDAYAGDREALVTVDIRDTGLFVALRRKSSFSGENIGDEENVSHIGQNVLRLASGTYEVLLRDSLFGWRQDRIETVEVPNGSVQTFVVERDFRQYGYAEDALAGLWNRFVWNGNPFTLTPVQAICVNRLLRRYAEGVFTATGQELVANAREALKSLSVGEPDSWSERPPALEDIFPRMGTFDPAQPEETPGALVLRVADTDEYRLAPAELSTIHVQIAHDGLAVVLSGKSGEVTFSGRTVERLGVAPGQYTVTLYDHKVQWSYWEQPTVPAGQIISSRTLSPITILRGETADIEFARDAEHFRQVAEFEIPEQQERVYFKWFDRETHTEQPGRNVVSSLNRDQAACIRVLLHAVADENPELTGEQIVVAAGIEGQTFEEVFADYAANFHSRRELPEGEEEREEPFEPWPGVIVRGEQENTWRLSAPPADMVSLDESVTQPAPVDDGPPDSNIGPKLTVEDTGFYSDMFHFAYVTVDIQDAGLSVSLQRVRAVSGENVGEEKIVSDVGRTIVSLPGGTYEVRLRDPLFGWRQTRIETVEIAPDDTKTFLVQRDFTGYAYGDDALAGERRHRFDWNGHTFALTPMQAICVNHLLRRYVEDDGTVDGGELVEVAREALKSLPVGEPDAWRDQPPRMEDIFPDIGAFDPDEPFEPTGSLVVGVVDTSEFRLAPAEFAPVTARIEHPYMSVTLTTADGTSLTIEGPAEATYNLPWGECHIITTDRLVEWKTPGDNPVYFGRGDSHLELGTGLEMDVSRNTDYLRRFAVVPFPEDVETLIFTWFPPEVLNKIPGVRQWHHYQLNRSQAECIKVLLHSRLAGEAGMAPEEIVTAAGLEGTTFDEVFPGGHTIWGNLFIKYARENRCTMVLPRSDLISLGDPESTPEPTFPPGQPGPGEDDSHGQTPPEPDPSAATLDSTDSSIASLDRLVELAEQEHQRLLQLQQAGAASAGEVREARISLLEARIRRAEAVGDSDGLAELLRQIVALRETRLAEVEELFNRGVVPVTDVNDARLAVLEARIRLAEAASAGDDLETLLGELVTLKEESLQRVEQLVASGVAGEEELNSANAALIEARLRLATARDETDAVRELLEQLISLREAELERAQRLYEEGATSDVEVDALEGELLETRIRLEELGPATEPDETC